MNIDCIDQATLIHSLFPVKKPAAIQHEGRGGVAAIASASSASGGHSGKKKKVKKSAKVSKGNMNLSMNGGMGPLHASSLLLVATWTLSELWSFSSLR